MNLPTPFAYPTTPHIRRHGPRGYKSYRDYKPFLRDEFTFRCVYCLEREVWYPNRDGSFSADHFVPKVIDPSLDTDYENLVYACLRCNAFKQAQVLLLNPARVAFADHFCVKEDGHIEALSLEAQDLIDLLDLNHAPALEVREETLRVLQLKQKYPTDYLVHTIFVGRFGYPSDLPDLRRLEPPGGNARPEGIKKSYWEQRKSGVLAEVY